ncbi:dCTP deaminase [Thermocatellispora tengchongensis]|uniref:dCTP deaminase n=1 Tax=Thermocatellispora tengchongensis TaxID=1073253 RepID=A0A840NU62_9ACTN|nr:2'-deoxycytidine 5'-triphosphate deaminase [Thermocatellispora tengchongensis]MBB5132274.1 dCTP deaminase [Thermocatellispora tengchongensis]
MILTGSAIAEAVARGDIVIDPFDESRVNPNSYNYRLGAEIYRVHSGDDPDAKPRYERLEPADGRFLLRKGRFYLGHTLERIGSDRYVTSLIGRSSMGRLGLFVQLSADLGHRGAVHRWTLELLPALDIYLYPGQILGQVSFWSTTGRVLPYEGWYGRHDRPMPSKLHTNMSEH